jgi:hypothetical protein
MVFVVFVVFGIMSIKDAKNELSKMLYPPIEELTANELSNAEIRTVCWSLFAKFMVAYRTTDPVLKTSMLIWFLFLPVLSDKSCYILM